MNTKRWALKQQTCILSRLWGLEAISSRAVPPPVGALRGHLFFASSSSRGRQQPWACGRITELGLHLQVIISSLLICVFCVPLPKALVVGLRAHTDHRRWWPHLKILNLVTSAKNLFPNEITFTGSRGYNVDIPFGGPPFHLYPFPQRWQ